LRVIGNLPYNISTPILFHLAQFDDSVKDLTVMLQREVAANGRSARHAGIRRLSVMLQARFRVERLFTVPAGAFRPAPKVESAVARLAPLREARPHVADEGLFAAIVAAAFGQRRKTRCGTHSRASPTKVSSSRPASLPGRAGNAVGRGFCSAREILWRAGRRGLNGVARATSPDPAAVAAA
jgi:16S rRNA A1518/A1519 N6-dimethyltransferase RsmA/KsgA/DIM1 with predicted DNA glycosylase/AP lyase activity